LLQRGPLERPRGLEHPRRDREPRAHRYRDMGQGGRADRLPREEVPPGDRDRGDLRGDREAPLRDHGAEAQPDAADGAGTPAVLPGPPSLRQGEGGPGARRDRRAGSRAGGEGEASRGSERGLAKTPRTIAAKNGLASKLDKAFRP